MAVAYHTHTFNVQEATDEQAAAGLSREVFLVPANLPPLLAEKQGLNDALTSIAGLTTSADQMIYATGADAYATSALTAYGRSIVGSIDASAVLALLGAGTTGAALFQDETAADARTTLELGSLALESTISNTNWSGADLAIENGGTGASSIEAARTNLGLGTAATADSTAFATAAQGEAADTAVQPGDGEAVPAGGTTGQVLAKASATDGDTFWTIAGQGDLISTNNGSDFADPAATLANLGGMGRSTYDPDSWGGRVFPFETRAEAEAATIPAPVQKISVIHNGQLLDYVRDAAGTALTTGGGAKWSPAGRITSDHWGAAGDGVTDDYASIQGAIDWTATVGGGEIHLDALHGVATGLVVSEDNVKLVGAGGGNIANGLTLTRNSAGTRIVWIGAAGTGTILKFDSNPADDGTKSARSGGGLKGVMLDGNEAALTCLELRSWQFGHFEDVHCIVAQEYGYKIWTLSNDGIGSSMNAMHNLFLGCKYSEINTSQNPVGMVHATQHLATNSCYNRFLDLIILMDGSGKGLVMENSDNDVFFGLKVSNRLGADTAIVELNADDTGTLFHDADCRHNAFFWAEARFVAKATIAGTSSSRNNMVFGHTTGNGLPLPVIEDGADLQYWSTDQFVSKTMYVTKKEDGAAAGPDFFLERVSSSPAVADFLGRLLYRARNSAGLETNYAGIGGYLLDPTAGSEDGGLLFQTYVGGTYATRMQLRSGLMVGDGLGDVGPGRVNAQAGFYANTTHYVIDGQGGVQLPSYTAANIASAANAVNTTNKRVGKQVWDTTNKRIMVADGSTATANWISAADPTVTVTPA